jgi:hypothetical protein
VRISRLATSLAAAAVMMAFTATSGGATAPPTSEPAAPVSAAATEASPAGELSEWEQIVPGGDCQCADGDEFSFWDRQADATKVVFFLEGGGACFDAGTCAFTVDQGETYDWNVGPDDHPDQQGGIFDTAHAGNPFADYSFIYVPYCTGDVHLGDVTSEYSPELTVEHNGWVNGSAAVVHLAENYPDAEQVVVVGESAGSIAAPVYAGVISDEMPDTQITVFGDGSGGYPDIPELNATVSGLWGVHANMPDWPENDGITAEAWSFPAFWVQAGTHDPDIVMARFDYAYDGTQQAFMSIFMPDTDGPAVLAGIDENEARIEGDGVTQHSYTAPGSDHTLVRKEDFYTMEVDGVTLVEWVDALIAGEPLDDVRCEECGGRPPVTTG